MTLQNCPSLGQVPNIALAPLTVKATISGIVILKQNTFRTRYTGSKTCVVDINGKLHLKRADLKKLQISESGEAIKNKPPHRNAGATMTLHKEQISQNLSTQGNGLLTSDSNLSTDKQYFVKKREVRQRLLGYINTQRGKKELYFWTVSFPQGVSDATAYRVYNTWLTALRQKRMIRNYLWVAERQANGTVHFHIAIPHTMRVFVANEMMRETLKNEIRKGNIDYSLRKINNYNGVDIAKNRNTRKVTNFAVKKGARSLAVYLTKYVTKNDTGFSHLAWHNSRGYSAIFTGVTFSVPEFVKYGFSQLINRSKGFTNDFFTFLPWVGDPPPLLVGHLFQLNSFIQENLN